MKFIEKITNMLFDEDEEIIEKVPVKQDEIRPTRTVAPEIIPPKIEEIKVEKIVEKPVKPIVNNVPEVNNDVKIIPKPVEQPKVTQSPFLDFDEDEFKSSMPYTPNRPERIERPEQKTSVTSRVEKARYNDYEREVTTQQMYDPRRTEKKEYVDSKEKKKFKPSLIISPVYGVLNEDYSPSDIRSIDDTMTSLDIDAVRKKAYGQINPDMYPREEKIVNTREEKTEIRLSNYQEEEKVKSIDEFLSSSSDHVIKCDEGSLEDTKQYEFNSYEQPTEEIVESSQAVKPTLEEESFESDLFDLIDSMYESKEDAV
ncbi:MAG: hypothetical protein R3Y13_01235 [bacterium]